jgi:hypothetical protein
MVRERSGNFGSILFAYRQLPVVLAGGGGGTIQGGRFHDLSKDENRKLCRLHIALMDRMGVKTNHFGDAENALAI